MIASAWNLAENTRNMVHGFSGTDDNRFLLPLMVHQHDVKDPYLMGTNGKMVEIIL